MNVRKILKRKKVLTVIAAVSLTLLGILIYLMIKPPSLSCLDSELYSKADQQKAMRSVKRDFLSLALEGCRLYSLSFAGDEACLREADHRPYDEVIVIRAEFRAPGSGGWNANGIYHWDWILAKNSRGKWVVIDKGDC